MADNTTNNQPLIGGDSENFMRLMNRALTRIEQVDSATTKANESLNNYAKSFDELNGKLERYVKLSGNAKSGKFDRITINERVQNVGGGSRGNRGNFGGGSSYSNTSGSNNQYEREAKRVTDNIMDTIFKSIDSLGGKQVRVITSTFKKITNTVADVKALDKGAKAAQNMAKTQKAATAATGASSKAIAGMSAAALGTTAVVSGVVVALVAMGAAGKYAYERNMEVNRSLMLMGDTAYEMTSSSSKTANQMIGIKNTWKRIGDDLSSVFEPVFTMIIDFVGEISSVVESITSPLDKDSKRQFTSSDSKARWYTSNLEKISGEPENTSLPVIGGIASTAKQSGFDNTSAANLAIGTYDMAMKKARQYGVEAGDVAKRLADAWVSGSDAAKDYGVVVDDQTLIGYMASKGVDIVNTQISDAMKQYYRYDLMQTELNANSNDAMQNQIKQWKQLGMQIDATKRKLFSFDEVIQLSALNTEIPTVGTPGVSYPNGDGSGSIPLVPPIIPGGGTPPGPSTVPSTSPVTVPVVYVPENEEALQPVSDPVTVPVIYAPEDETVLQPVPDPVTIPVFVPGLDLVGDLIYELGLVWGLLPVPVEVPVTVPDFGLLTSLEEMLDTLKGLVPLPVKVDVDVPDFELAPTLLDYCMQLAAQPFVSTIAFGIPALALAPTLLDYLYDIAKSWAAKVDITVAGTALLEKAKSLLQTVLSLVARAGQAVMSGVSNAYNTARSGVSSAYNAAKTYVTGGSGAWETAAKQDGYSARDINTAKSMAKKNSQNWDTLSSYQKTQYVKVADEVNSNIMLTQADGIEMLNSYNKTGQATSSKVNWINTEGTQIANNSLKVAGGLGLAGAGLVTGGLVAPLLKGAGSTALSAGASAGAIPLLTGEVVSSAGTGAIPLLTDAAAAVSNVPLLTDAAASSVGAVEPVLRWLVWLNEIGVEASAFGMATGGIGTKETTIRAFEGNKKEAVIPLETQAGVDYLANAMRQAGAGDGSGDGSITVNLTLSGVNIADNDAQWQKVGEKIAEVIEVQRQRRGDLNYGSSF